jgi:hypothetical protein
MSSRAFLNSFMLCPRLRAKSGNFFAPKRTRTMRRMINRSGPPRFPIPNARIFITILNWSGPMLYSPRTGEYSLYNAQIALYDLEPKLANRRRSASHLVRLSLLGVGAITKFDPLAIPEKGRVRALFGRRLQDCCISRPAKALRSSALTSETAQNSNPSRSQCETL